MSESIIRQKIYTIMQSVPDIGKVWDYDRWTADWNTFINLFKSPVHEQIRGWEILRKSAPAEYDSNCEETTTHIFNIRGYMALNDAAKSEITFNNLIEAARKAFRFNFTLDGLCESAGPLSVDLIEPRMFGSVLCHYCELSLPVKELNTI